MRAVIFAAFVACSTPAIAATPWVCVKDGKEIKIKGKKPKVKQKKCEEKGGTWEKKAAAESAPKEPAEDFDSSSGW